MRGRSRQTIKLDFPGTKTLPELRALDTLSKFGMAWIVGAIGQ